VVPFAVRHRRGKNQPRVFSLDRAAPNPTGQHDDSLLHTRLTPALTLSVYSATGRHWSARLRTDGSGRDATSATWNGQDGSGRSCIRFYLYRLRPGTFSATARSCLAASPGTYSHAAASAAACPLAGPVDLQSRPARPSVFVAVRLMASLAPARELVRRAISNCRRTRRGRPILGRILGHRQLPPLVPARALSGSRLPR